MSETRSFPEDPRYSVSDDGTVYGLKGQPLKPQPNGKYGYLAVQLGRARRLYVHQIVALTFIGPREGRDVDHRDGITSNNSRDNLRYLDHPANMAAQRERKPLCKKGHPFAGNEYWHKGRRSCVECRRARERAAYQRAA